MHNEIRAAVLFLVQLIEKSEKFSQEQLKCFQIRLVELLLERFKNHWFPDKPFKGQGYRCIRVNGNSRRDRTLESAAKAAGVKYEDLSLPVELTLWVDPNEVCCRFGESKGSYCTLASFEDKENSKPNKLNRRKNDEESRRNEDSIKLQKSLVVNHAFGVDKNVNNKEKPLGSVSQNIMQNQHQQQVVGGRRRNLQSPRGNLNRNRSWFNHSFNMGYGPHPMSQPWYNVMPPHPQFIGGPSPPPFIGQRGQNKWPHHPSSSSSSYLSSAAPARFQNWSQKATLKV